MPVRQGHCIDFGIMLTTNKRWLWAGFIAATAAGAGVLFVCDPSGCRLFPPCPFHYLTGLYCPGCGSLRALHQLLNGHPLAALALNPLMVVFLPFVLYGLLAEAVRMFFGRRIPMPFLKPLWIWAIFWVIVLYGIARNIPMYPFTCLAP